jgi:ferredoxin-type protein NapH
VLSFWLDIQILEGALTASRFAGFHLIDLNAALQVMLAHKHIIMNLVIGTLTVFALWAMLGGRSFCSWVCPYHLLAEFTEKIHLALVRRKLVTEHEFHRGVRTVFWILFAMLAFVTGYTVFETLSPTGILSRALIYGPGLALGWVFLLLAFEVFWSRRAWCRYVCPIGLTYGVVGAISPLRVNFRLEHCLHEGDCRKVCLVPHVLDVTIRGRAAETGAALGPDCTRCGLCVDVCRSGALGFEIKGISRLLDRRRQPRINPRQNTRVLAIGSSPVLLAATKDYLESAHCLFLSAPDAQAGLDAALNAMPALIFLDSALPGGDAAALLRTLRENPASRDIPVIVMGNDETTPNAFADADDFMQTPFTRFIFFAHFTRLLDESRTPRRLPT